MIPAAFDYVRPATLDEALGLLAQHGEDAKVLAGGHSLIPAMKLRLSQPKVVVDIGRIGDLRSIGERDGKIAIGGSCVHADPAGDWPAAMLALDAEFEITGPRGSRTVAANDFFVDMLTSAVDPGEILKSIRLPVTAKRVAYAKFTQKASGFAIAGVAAVVDETRKSVAIGVTGVAAKG